MKLRAVITLTICACVIAVIACVAVSLLQTPSDHTHTSLAAAGTPARTTTTAAATATSTPSPTATPSPVGWTTILDDEFNTPGLPAQWSVYNGRYGDRANNCAAPSQVQVPGDGYLHLKMQYLSSGPCGAGWYTGGMQVDPAYGGVDQAITVRWRIVPSADPSDVHSHHIIPMRWVDDSSYPWYRGESNYCESSTLYSCDTFLHYGPNGTQVYHTNPVDLTQWHTWRVEVRNHTVSIFIDDMTSPVWVYQGDETTTPNSSKRVVLQQECPLSGCPSSAYQGNVEDIQIDWITIQNATGVNPLPNITNGTTASSPAAQAGQTAGSATAAIATVGPSAFTGSIASLFASDIASTLPYTLRRFSTS